MARISNKLTDLGIKSIQPTRKAQKLFDGGGLFLMVTPAGGKYWRIKYRFNGKEKLLSLGVYPDVSLSDARDKREEVKKQLKNNINPSQARKIEKHERILNAENTFEVVAREWHDKQAHTWTPTHCRDVLNSLEHDIFPDLGDRPIKEITPWELLSVLQKIEKRGALEVAARTLQRCGAVFRYAVATSRAETNPAADLKGALTPRVKKNYAALDEEDLPDFLEELDNFGGYKTTQLAIRLLMLTFVRTGELIAARWTEFDLDEHIWRIPADRMKMRREHLVPLSDQAVVALEELKELTGRCELIFPGRMEACKPISNNTVLMGLRRMGFQKRMTGHGFRTMASTYLNEAGYPPDAIERQLAHVEKNKVRGAYNKALYLDRRRELMQAWADYLDAMKDDSEKVIPLNRKQV